MDYQLGPGPLQVDQNTIDEKIKGDIGIVENGDVATHAITNGYYVIWKGDLYVAKTDISSGTTLSAASNGNLTAKPSGLGAEVAALNSKINLVRTENVEFTTVDVQDRAILRWNSNEAANRSYRLDASANNLHFDESTDGGSAWTTIYDVNSKIDSKNLVNYNLPPETKDLNLTLENMGLRQYDVSATGTPTTNGGVVFTMLYANNQGAQIAKPNNQSFLNVRWLNNGTWSAWMRFSVTAQS